MSGRPTISAAVWPKIASAPAFQKMIRPLPSAEMIPSRVDAVTARKRSSAARSSSSPCLRAVMSLPQKNTSSSATEWLALNTSQR